MRCLKCMKEYKDTYDMCPYCGSERELEPKEMYFLHPGTVIADRYLIGTSIGSGGFGITYKAWDKTLAKVVAVKEYYPVGMVNRVPGEKKLIIYSGNREREYTNGKVRFLEEARNMAKFSKHPNIINVYDFFEDNNTAYIIMEFLDGQNYKEYIKEQGGKVPLEKALEITEAVLEALMEVHKTGILHRDISPDNIFICKDGKVKVIDFGAARFSSIDTAITRSVILKPGFAPPEQYQSKSKQGPWTDIYAVGATLYRAVTGNVPEESVNRVEEDLLTDPEKFCPEMTNNLNNIILRSMAVLPELRFQSTAEFLNALRSNINIKNVRKELKFRKVRRLVTIVGLSAVVLVGALFCIRALNEKKAAAAVLEPAEISIWIPVDAADSVEEEQMIFEEAIETFKTMYPQITVNLECMEREEYNIKLQEAMASGNLPTLFESSTVTKENYKYLAELSKVFDFIEADKYYFLDKYETYFSSGKQMPMSFTVPVVYYATIVNTEGKTAEQLVSENNYLVSTEDIVTYHNLYSDKEQILNLGSWYGDDSIAEPVQNYYESQGYSLAASEQLFIDNTMACLISNTSSYEVIQKNLAGVYEMELLAQEGMVGAFKDCFSISEDASADEKAAAVQVLVYLLTDTAQDVRYVQNGTYLPLHKSVYAAYVDINREFETLDESFEYVVFAGENQTNLDTWYEWLEK